MIRFVLLSLTVLPMAACFSPCPKGLGFGLVGKCGITPEKKHRRLLSVPSLARGDAPLEEKVGITGGRNLSEQVRGDNSIICGPIENIKRGLASFLLSLLVLSNVSTAILPAGGVASAESRMVGEIKGSGLVFKDTLNVESFDDPKVKGVTLYITNFQRPITEKIQKGDLFSDPSFASVGCAKTGPVSIADNIAIGKGGEEVFEESRSLLFKTLRVQRIYDKEKNTVVYVSFNTRIDKSTDANKSRFKSSICAVNLE